MAPVWVRLYHLLIDFWIPEILEGIGQTLGQFFKVSEVTKRGRNMSYVGLCVYMNISQPLLESIELDYQGEILNQLIDYEHVPFR